MTWSTVLAWIARQVTAIPWSMQGGAVANNLALLEYDLALIDADHGPQLVVEELCPRCLRLFVNRIRSPIDSVIFSRSNTLNLVTGQVATASRRRPFRR